jgi:hypothetical protein
VHHRISLLTQVIRLLLTMIPDQRQITIREAEAAYEVNLSRLLTNAPLSDETINSEAIT